MAYKVSTEGMDELFSKLNSLGNAAQGVAAAGLFEGAGVMADAVSRGVQGISTDPFRYATGGEQRKPSPEEKAMLEAAPKGISRFRKDGLSVDTSVGFSRAGYGKISWNHARGGTRTKYKIGKNGKTLSTAPTRGKSTGGSVKPVEVIANAINSGTSFMQRQPFFRKAVNSAKAKAIQAIDTEIENRIDQIGNE